MFSRSACIDNLFATMEKATKADSNLTKQLVKLY
jgi:hypothetical protein